MPTRAIPGQPALSQPPPSHRRRPLPHPALLLGLLIPLHIPMMGVESCSSDDIDGDGFTMADGDCDDLDASAFPGAPELCDTHDNNCDGSVDEGIACAGRIATAAGDGLAGYVGDGGLAYEAKLAIPYGAAIDPRGGYFIADTSNNVVRRVDASGLISTYAGNHVGGYSGDGAAATAAQLSQPKGLACDAVGTLYIADTSNNVIRKVTTAGVISTVAGSNAGGYSGDGGQATSAKLMLPSGVAVDAGNNLYIADTNNERIRKVNPNGVISTFAGDGTGGFAGDGGQATAAELLFPTKLRLDGQGNMFIADTGNARVRKINTAGVITTVAGNGKKGYAGDGGQATAAQLDQPDGVGIDASGNLFIADTHNQRVRRVDPSGIISTIAGTGVGGVGGDTGPATAAKIHDPEDVVIDAQGNLLVVDSANSSIRKVWKSW